MAPDARYQMLDTELWLRVSFTRRRNGAKCVPRKERRKTTKNQHWRDDFFIFVFSVPSSFILFFYRFHSIFQPTPPYSSLHHHITILLLTQLALCRFSSSLSSVSPCPFLLFLAPLLFPPFLHPCFGPFQPSPIPLSRFFFFFSRQFLLFPLPSLPLPSL